MAHLRDGGQGRALHGARVRNVDAVGPAHGGADFRGRRFQTRGVYVPEADPPALGGDPPRDAESDARRPAGHNGGHSLETFGVRHIQPS